jgi:hypothetical protein
MEKSRKTRSVIVVSRVGRGRERVEREVESRRERRVMVVEERREGMWW